MLVAGIRFCEKNNKLEEIKILANSLEEAENYLHEVKADSLKVEHIYLISQATKFSVFSSNDENEPKVLNWVDENSSGCGRVNMWTELPSSIKQESEKI